MRCYNCGAQLSEKSFCTHCRVDVSRYKIIMSMANYYYNDGLEKAGIRDLSGAVASLRQCLKMNKYHIEARNLLGLVHYEMGEVVQAVSEWVISKNLCPERNIADDYIASIQNNLNLQENWNQAYRKYNQALAYCYQDSTDMAIIQLKKVLSTTPNFLQAHLLLAMLYITSGEAEKAEKEIRKCLKVDRGNTMALRYAKEVDRILAQQNEGKNNKKQSKEDKILKYQSGNETIIQPANAFEPRRGAGWVLNIIIGIAVGLAISWFLILPARIQTVNNEHNAKITQISEEIDKKSAQIGELEQKVTSLKQENENLKALTEVYAGQDGELNTVETLLNAAYIYLDTPDDIEKLTEAIEKVDREAIESEETSEVVRNLYSKLLLDAGTDIAKNYYDAGYKAYREENYDEAIENLKKAVTYDPSNGEALFVLGNSYKEKGNKKSAIETYEQVIELFPGTSKASKSQKYIEQLQAEE